MDAEAVTRPSREGRYEPDNVFDHGGKVARLFGLSGEHWMRHANPLSVWTRFSVPSLLAVSVWSRVWIGWYSLIAVAISIV
jgi:hypothetical protein